MAAFSTFDQALKLTGVRVTDRELGHGSYATVLELEYMGLKCAGKKIHDLLLMQGDSDRGRRSVRRFEDECRLLSQVRHPNIVQFLGVYFQQSAQVPILVMEFLPTNLTSCIEQYGILPMEISYSILHDVALGLCYLHNQTPPIIHRDLSSNNVLLTPNMTAKISDLGVARILNLNLTELEAYRMTQTPGTRAYMPPEMMVANPIYDTSVDEFSYGILMIHMFSGQWPEPQVGQVRIEPGRIIPVSEADRRDIFLQAIGNDHPLMDLIHKCIDNHPQSRPYASEIVERLADMVLQFPASFANQLEQISLRREMERKDKEIQELQAEVELLRTMNNVAAPSKACITWKQCPEPPIKSTGEKTTVINSKVYCGGRLMGDNEYRYIVYCYDPSLEKWTTLPPLPVRWFGLGQVKGKLVAIGGVLKINESTVNEVYTYDDQSQKWKQTIPPMPTARDSPGVLSLQSVLVVAGGDTPWSYTDAVEIFKPDTSQWYRTDPLPMACRAVSLAAIGNILYALGGFKYPSRLNQALSVSVTDLLGNAVPANQTTHIGSRDTHSAWKTLPNTPTYRPAAAVLAGNLLAIGGDETAEGGDDKKEVYMYSPSTNSWIHNCDLPAPQALSAVAVLSSAEILVMVRRPWWILMSSKGVNTLTMYKGTLCDSHT